MADSVISSTDVQIFKRLANPDIADVELLPASVTKDAQRKATASLRAAIDKAASSSSGGGGVTTQPSKSVLSKAMEQVKQVASASRRDDDAESKRSSAAGESPKSVASPKAAVTAQPPRRPPPPTEAPPLPPPSSAPRRVPDAPPQRTSYSDDDVRQQKSSSDSNIEDERMEKQGYLIELRRMQARGVQLSRTFTESDSLAELEFEVAKQNASISTENSVSFMRDMLRLVITGLEIGNNKLGPFLSMDGWAEATTQDMHRYDHALERIHRRYFRKQQMSPIMEMAWLLLGSLAMWHFKSKFLGATPGGAPSSSSSVPSSTATTANKKSSPAPVRQNMNPSPARQGGRPLLRAPQTLFGGLASSN